MLHEKGGVNINTSDRLKIVGTTINLSLEWYILTPFVTALFLFPFLKICSVCCVTPTIVWTSKITMCECAFLSFNYKLFLVYRTNGITFRNAVTVQLLINFISQAWIQGWKQASHLDRKKNKVTYRETWILAWEIVLWPYLRIIYLTPIILHTVILRATAKKCMVKM